MLLLGGALSFLAASRPWFVLHAVRPEPFAALGAHIAGRTVFPATSGLSIVMLLAAVVVAIAGRWTRLAVGILVLAVSIASAWFAVRGFAVPGQQRATELLGGAARTDGVLVTVSRQSVWPAVALLGSVVAVVGSGIVIARCWHWPAGLGRRYDAPVVARAAQDPWRTLDRGGDPTIEGR
jgi:hypothetical protein